MSPLDLHRRAFVSRIIVGSASSLLAGRIWSSRLLGTILNGPAGILKVKVSDYPALQAQGGSIQLNVTGSSAHPLMINRGGGNAFYALDSDCQHLHCVVPPYNPATGLIRCSCHGSRYAIDGSLIGGPATRGLNAFASVFDGIDTLRVTVPGLLFSTEIAVENTSASSTRLRLQFNIQPYSTYRVYYQPELADVPQITPFSSTPSGVANLTSDFATASPATVYVDSTVLRGFYSVALVASPY